MKIYIAPSRHKSSEALEMLNTTILHLGDFVTYRDALPAHNRLWAGKASRYVTRAPDVGT